ncbi:hypothetical protein HD806DRAFT_530382 [Xylariaceae sp. AK1471]|nr:hypothetical protein HD806DRAFT_530382 [Xylariaceae sp. AK1471]
MSNVESIKFAGDQIIASADRFRGNLLDVPEDVGTQTLVNTLSGTETLNNLSTIPNGYWYDVNFPGTEKWDNLINKDIDDLPETVSNSII